MAVLLTVAAIVGVAAGVLVLNTPAPGPTLFAPHETVLPGNQPPAVLAPSYPPVAGAPLENLPPLYIPLPVPTPTTPPTATPPKATPTPAKRPPPTATAVPPSPTPAGCLSTREHRGKKKDRRSSTICRQAGREDQDGAWYWLSVWENLNRDHDDDDDD